MKTTRIFQALVIALGVTLTIQTRAQSDSEPSYGEQSRQASAEPIRPGEPGGKPFWNGYAERFIYAPAFDLEKVSGAEKYRFELASSKDVESYSFTGDVPWAPLSPVWADLPVGSYELKVVGLSASGEVVGTAGTRQFYRAAPFDGIYHEPVLPYDTSAKVALRSVLEKDYVQYWLDHKQPDPDYGWYRYPSKIYSALVVGAVTQARLTEGSEEAERSIKLARIVADSLIEISFPKGAPLEYFPPTYYGYREIFEKDSNEHMFYDRSMIIHGADAGHAYLDLYDVTGEEKYLDAAKRIARTYLKTQLDNGSWYLYVNNETGEPAAPNIAIPTSTINYFTRLKKDYGMEGLDESSERAFKWTMDNPVKTFNWQGQFEDISARAPYENQSREQACDLAIHLFRNARNDPEMRELAKDLIRFSEDQFVIWEQPQPQPEKGRSPGALPQNWITPCVQEQYAYWRPISRSAGIMIDTYWEAYVATGDAMYLAKAKSIANAFTAVQEAHEGDYPTHFTRYKMNFWLNNAVHPAKVMMNFERKLAEGR